LFFTAEDAKGAEEERTKEKTDPWIKQYFEDYLRIERPDVTQILGLFFLCVLCGEILAA